jgi:hypothetical protein
MHRTSAGLGLALGCLLLAACGGSSGGSAPTPSAVPITTIDEPLTLQLYPNESSDNPARLTVMVTAVGSVPVSMPLGFDTGSAGITLYAPSIFPASMVGANGFIFPPGESQMSYQGITVTNQQGTRTYGSVLDTRNENGNLGFATVTFGDAAGEVITQAMPVFLYYSITDNQTGSEVPEPTQQGWFGVADTSGTIVVPGSVEPAAGFPACSSSSVGTCYVVSVLKYINYAAGVSAGFSLAPTTVQDCDIAAQGSCTPAPILTLGLNASLETGYTTQRLVCPPNGYVGPADIAGYPVCQKTILNTTISTLGETVSGYSLFDSGTPGMQISTPAGSSFPLVIPDGTTVTFTQSSGFSYSYTAGQGYFNTTVEPDTSTVNIIGIGFFTTNSLFIDFATGIEGWK